MHVIEEKTERGVTERRFDLEVGDEKVPGIQWLPDGASGSYPTVLVGHGGTAHKRVPNVLSLARSLVRHVGVGVVAIDAPEHGDRVSDQAQAEERRKSLENRIASGGGDAPPISESWRKQMAARIPKHVAEWQAVIDDLQTDERWAAGPFGWWGLSMGTTHGLPVVAQEPRISCAVLGLNALRSEKDPQAKTAASISVPVLFLLQADDELMTRDAGIALYDAIGSKEKTLHLNPGGHVGVPAFELQAFENFFQRHLFA